MPGLFGALTGTAGELEQKEGTELFKDVLLEGENVLRAYKFTRDAFAFTEKRLISMDVQGLTGKKVEWHFLPYGSISHFSVESAGMNDWDSELKIYISGNSAPVVTKKLNRKMNMHEVSKAVSYHVFGDRS